MSPLILPILIPILAALLIMVGTDARRTAITAALINLVFTFYIFTRYDVKTGGYQLVSSLPVLPSMGIAFTLGVDGFSLIMLLLSTLVTLCAVLTARSPAKGESWFYVSLLLISVGGIGAFLSVDVFFFYMFHELALIPTFLLIGIWGSGDRQAAAWKATIYLALGSFILLLGIIGLYLSMPEAARSFDMRNITALAVTGQWNPILPVYLLLLFGFGILVSLFPFHTWAPQAYACAPAPAAMLHAGVLKKFGLYGLLRLVVPVFPTIAAEEHISICGLFNVSFINFFLVLIVGNILYVGYVTVSQRKLDTMLGYSSVMHMGYLFLGFAAMNVLSLTGAAMMLFAHGLTVAALFALCGELRERTGTLEFSELGGLAKVMPTFGLLFGFATMASVGLPGFLGFAAELLIFFGSFAAGSGESFYFNNFQFVTVIAVWGVVISAIYMLRAYRRIFMGALNDRWAGLPEISFAPRMAILTLIVVLLFTGFFPQFLVNYLKPVLLCQ